MANGQNLHMDLCRTGHIVCYKRSKAGLGSNSDIAPFMVGGCRMVGGLNLALCISCEQRSFEKDSEQSIPSPRQLIGRQNSFFHDPEDIGVVMKARQFCCVGSRAKDKKRRSSMSRSGKPNPEVGL